MGSQRMPSVAEAWEAEREDVLKEEVLAEEGMKVPRRRKMAEGLTLDRLQGGTSGLRCWPVDKGSAHEPMSCQPFPLESDIMVSLRMPPIATKLYSR